jgi:hypothetical protein
MRSKIQLNSGQKNAGDQICPEFFPECINHYAFTLHICGPLQRLAGQLLVCKAALGFSEETLLWPTPRLEHLLKWGSLKLKNFHIFCEKIPKARRVFRKWNAKSICNTYLQHNEQAR